MTAVSANVLRMLSPHVAHESKAMFDVLRAPDDWTRALEFSKSICATLPFILAVKRAEWFDDLPIEAREECESMLARERMVLALLDDELELATDFLVAAEIPVIVLKGMDVGRRFYPERMLRPMGDVDLLVPAKLYRDAWRVLLRGGYQQIEPHFRHSFRSSLARGTELPSIDLHHGLIAGDSGSAIENYWKNSQPGPFQNTSDKLRVLSAEDCLVYVLRHSAVLHVLESPIWLVDLHYLISGSSLDWKYVLAELRRSKALSAAAFVFEILHSNWQTPLPNDLRAELNQRLGIVRRTELKKRLQLSAWYRPQGRNFFSLAFDRFLLRETGYDAISFGLKRIARKATEAVTRDQATKFADQIVNKD